MCVCGWGSVNDIALIIREAVFQGLVLARRRLIPTGAEDAAIITVKLTVTSILDYYTLAL